MSKGQNQDFMEIVHPSMYEKCKKYVQRSKGPQNIFLNKDGRTPIQFVKDTFKGLEQYKDKIAVVIDGSTTRGFAQPSQSSLYCQELGIQPNECFDMVEACNGFARSLETAYNMYLTKPEYEDKYILLINNEQPPKTRGVLPTDETDYKSVASYYVGLTFSHVCTLTLLEKSDNHSWKFKHYTKTDYASNINIPLPGIAKGYTPSCEHFDILLNDQYGQFCIPSFHDAQRKAFFALSEMERNYKFWHNANVICHTFSRYVYEKFFMESNLQHLSLYYNETGNLGSCSLPFILNDQYGETDMPKNQKVCFVGNGAGGSNILVIFKHKNEDNQEYVPIIEQEMMKKYEIMGRILIRKKINQLLRTWAPSKIISWQKQDHNQDHLYKSWMYSKKLDSQNSLEDTECSTEQSISSQQKLK